MDDMLSEPFPLYPATVPPSETEGELRTQNSPGFEVQRSVITDRGEESPYKIQCVLAACLHGILDKSSKTPASLIIFDYFLFNNKPGSKFTSVTTHFDFSEYVTTQAEKEAATAAGTLLSTNPGDANPSVIAYAPFTQPMRWNFSTADKTSRNNFEGTMGADAAPAKAEAKIGHESEISYTQKFFDEGKAGRHYQTDTKRYYQVWWNMMHNHSQKEGVAPTFRVAMLVQRKSTTAKFRAIFNLVVKGDVCYELSKQVDKFFRRTGIDDPINFDPAIDKVGILKDKIDKEELGLLADEERLESLSRVWGMAPLNSVQSTASASK